MCRFIKTGSGRRKDPECAVAYLPHTSNGGRSSAPKSAFSGAGSKPGKPGEVIRSKGCAWNAAGTSGLAAYRLDGRTYERTAALLAADLERAGVGRVSGPFNLARRCAFCTQIINSERLECLTTGNRALWILTAGPTN